MALVSIQHSLTSVHSTTMFTARCKAFYVLEGEDRVIGPCDEGTIINWKMTWIYKAKWYQIT